MLDKVYMILGIAIFTIRINFDNQDEQFKAQKMDSLEFTICYKNKSLF